MVDYCPDTEEYYWLEAEKNPIPNWYHIVFFDVPKVTRSWIKTEDIKRMSDPTESPFEPSKPKTIKKKLAYRKALDMALESVKMDRETRLKTYSFVARFKGKWGHYSDSGSNEDDEVPGLTNKKKVKQGPLDLWLLRETTKIKVWSCFY